MAHSPRIPPQPTARPVNSADKFARIAAAWWSDPLPRLKPGYSPTGWRLLIFDREIPPREGEAIRSVIDPEDLFSGDRLRHCSNLAKLHWPRLLLASDGFARLEINYARIIGRAYATFDPVPSEKELVGWLQGFSNYLLFPYPMDGRLWGQWDTRPGLLSRYKTASDRRSPQPPETELKEWKRRYKKNNLFPK